MVYRSCVRLAKLYGSTWDMVFEGKWDHGNFEKEWESNGERNDGTKRKEKMRTEDLMEMLGNSVLHT